MTFMFYLSHSKRAKSPIVQSSFYSGVCLGRCLQAADGPWAGSEELPGLPRKRRLPGHHGDLSPTSTSRFSAQPDAALHRLSGQPGLPRSRPSGGDRPPDRQLHRSERTEHWVSVSAGWRFEDNPAGGLRLTSVFSRNASEGETTTWEETPAHSNRLNSDLIKGSNNLRVHVTCDTNHDIFQMKNMCRKNWFQGKSAKI